MDREAFLQERLTGFGASDEGALFNIAPGCSRHLFYQKTEAPPDYERDMGAADLGTYLEEYVRLRYSRETGVEVVKPAEMLRHAEDHWLIAHLDGIIGGTTAWECKTMSGPMFYSCRRDGLPEGYILQLQHGMLVSGLTTGVFTIMSRDTGQMESFPVSRDERLQEAIRKKAAEMWRAKEEGVWPPPLDPTDKRCRQCEYRRTCQGGALIVDEPGAEPEYDVSLAELARQHAEAKAALDEAEGAMESVQAALRKAMGLRTVVDTEGARVYYRPYSRESVDTAALKLRHPRAWKKFRKVTIVRPLKVYPR